MLRAPGRVNLIGEHTDYNGLPVLPIAIDREILVAASPRSDHTIEVRSVDPRFGPRRFEMSNRIEPYASGDWGNYAKAAAQALRQFIPEKLRGFDAVVSGNIPIASGLSSSSALVVALALALLEANGKSIDRTVLAELLAEGERYVGTRGGGMDQAVCLMAREGHALKIDFFPLVTRHIPIPAGYSFIVSHSMVEADKSASARAAYNLRAAESHMAAAVLAGALAGRVASECCEIERLGDLQKKAGLSDEDIDSLVEETFEKDTYSLVEVAEFLGEGVQRVRRAFLGAFSDEEVRSFSGFKLRPRCRHVVSEGRRVERAVEALRAGDMCGFGALMCQSHRSCSVDYEVSCTELDMLTEIAMESGALGSRLTGAGFGGCAISLVPDDRTERFFEKVRKKYYRDQGRRERVSDADLMFVCRPVSAAEPVIGR
ncbi:MAG: galactokinase [Candidatus Abyssubacteria bacterium]